ncbi:MAG: response regulator transcription factor [Alphaproteobacteria bacterium]
MTHKIILVDDDRNITTSLSMALEAEGFKTTIYNDGEAGLKGIEAETPDLVILDVKMPRMNGKEVLTKLRETNQSLPVIFLTSKDDEQDQLDGFQRGADDYITKPFSQNLLIQRIHALLRRAAATPKNTNPTEPPENTIGNETITNGDLTLDNARFLCIWKGVQINLTVTEYLLLLTLAQTPGTVKTREQLIHAAYGETLYIDDRTIDSHIKRVRKKFKKTDETFDALQSIYGAGYRFNG